MNARSLVAIALGAALLLGGLGMGLVTTGAILLGDCGPDCQARGERVVGGLMAAGFFALAVFGGWLARRGWLDRAG